MHSICCSVYLIASDLKYMSLCKNVLMSYTVLIWMLKHTFMECLLYVILVTVMLLFEYHKYCVLFFYFQTKIQLYCWVLHWHYPQLSMRDLYSSFMKCFCRRDTQTVLVMIITGTKCGIHCRLVLYWCGALTDLVDPNCMELLIIAEIWLRHLLIFMDPVCKHHAVNMTGCHKGTYLISAFGGDK